MTLFNALTEQGMALSIIMMKMATALMLLGKGTKRLILMLTTGQVITIANNFQMGLS